MRKFKKNPTAIPWRYALEYEIQLVGKNPETGEVVTFNLEIAPRTGFASASTWEQQAIVDVIGFLFRADITLDVGNIELRNREVHGTVDSALIEINLQLADLVEVLKDGLDFEFALFLPAARFYARDRALSATKHLNISYDEEDEEGAEVLAKAVDTLLADYPQYLAYASYPAVGTHLFAIWIKLPAFAWELAGPRIHIKLPYTFTDYDGLFEGTAELPALEGLPPGTGSIPGWEKTVLLGYVNKYGRWITKNSLV